MTVSQWRKNFKYFREKKFKNQTELASMLGTTQQTITNWEKGIGAPKLEKFLQITKLFGISFEEMMESNIENGESVQIKSAKITTKRKAILDRANSEKDISSGLRQPLLEKSAHLEEIIHLQKENIYSLEKRLLDKDSIESMLTAENDRLKSELKRLKAKNRRDT